jgi:hypothetical protein
VAGFPGLAYDTEVECAGGNCKIIDCEGGTIPTNHRVHIARRVYRTVCLRRHTGLVSHGTRLPRVSAARLGGRWGKERPGISRVHYLPYLPLELSRLPYVPLRRIPERRPPFKLSGKGGGFRLPSAAVLAQLLVTGHEALGSSTATAGFSSHAERLKRSSCLPCRYLYPSVLPTR